MDSVLTALCKLLCQPNALTYDVEKLKSIYNYESILSDCSGDELAAEIWMISSELCGSANHHLATAFMQGSADTDDFLDNVSFNGSRSTPLIVRAINIRWIALSNDLNK